MFSKLAIVASLALLAVATPTPGGGEGATFCCSNVMSFEQAQNEGILSLITVPVQDIGQNVGVDCTVRFSGLLFVHTSAHFNFPSPSTSSATSAAELRSTATPTLVCTASR